MRIFIGIIVAIGLALFSYTARPLVPTDVDIHFSNRYHHGAKHYKENCLKPKPFRGWLKFKVSCSDLLNFVVERDLSHRQIDEYFAEQIPIVYMRGGTWSIVDGRDLGKYKISPRSDDPPIYILKREQREYPNCERLIFLSYSYETGKVYLADPRKLYCKSS